MGGGSDPGPSREGFEEVTWEVGRILQGAFLSCVSPPVFQGYCFSWGSQRGRVGVESDPGGLRPETQGFRTAGLARLVQPWEAEPGCVYPGWRFRSRWAPVSAASQELG